MGNPRFEKLLREVKELHDRKAADYASAEDPLSNFRHAARVVEMFVETGSAAEDVVFAALVGVKLARLAQLSQREPNNESRRDTLRDLMVYAGLWTTLEEERSAPSGEPEQLLLPFAWRQWVGAPEAGVR